MPLEAVASYGSPKYKSLGQVQFAQQGAVEKNAQ